MIFENIRDSFIFCARLVADPFPGTGRPPVTVLRRRGREVKAD
jgi:hypothetical protein